MPNQVNAEKSEIIKKFPYLGFWKITKTDYVELTNGKTRGANLKMLDLSGVSFELKFNRPIKLMQDTTSIKNYDSEVWNTDETGIVRWTFEEETAQEIRDLPLFSCYVFNVSLTCCARRSWS